MPGLVAYYNVTFTAVNRTAVSNIITNTNSMSSLLNNMTFNTTVLNPSLVSIGFRQYLMCTRSQGLPTWDLFNLTLIAVPVATTDTPLVFVQQFAAVLYDTGGSLY